MNCRFEDFYRQRLEEANVRGASLASSHKDSVASFMSEVPYLILLDLLVY